MTLYHVEIPPWTPPLNLQEFPSSELAALQSSLHVRILCLLKWPFICLQNVFKEWATEPDTAEL